LGEVPASRLLGSASGSPAGAILGRARHRPVTPASLERRNLVARTRRRRRPSHDARAGAAFRRPQKGSVRARWNPSIASTAAALSRSRGTWNIGLALPIPPGPCPTMAPAPAPSQRCTCRCFVRPHATPHRSLSATTAPPRRTRAADGRRPHRPRPGPATRAIRASLATRRTTAWGSACRGLRASRRARVRRRGCGTTSCSLGR